MIKREDVYNIGKITKSHALKGEVVFNFSDDIFDRTESEYLICEIDGILVPFFMEEYRFKSDTSVLVKFEGIDSAEATRQLLGADVYFEKSKAIESGEEDMSLRFFIGFKMTDENGKDIGVITDIDDNTQNWLFIVENPKGEEILIPAHEEFISEIDNENKIMKMVLPEGLTEL